MMAQRRKSVQITKKSHSSPFLGTRSSGDTIIQKVESINDDETNSPVELDERNQIITMEKKSGTNWAVAIGVGLTVVAAAATTVYIVNNKRQRELDVLKYGTDQQNDEWFFSRYWQKTKHASNIVYNFAVSLFKGKEVYTPMESVNVVSPFVVANSHEEIW